MMQLNRAVCLDYPEFNVPWFHKKYIEEHKSNTRRDKEEEIEFYANVKSYLLKFLPTNNMEQYVTTPYGYLIDFLIKNLDKIDGLQRGISMNTK